jgi:outer membrane protein TolC
MRRLSSNKTNTKGHSLWPLVFVFIGLLDGCASYSAQPLEARPALLSGPTLTELAQAPRRDYLKPVSIDLTQPLDANAIATIAVIANPDLKAQRVQARVNDAQVFQAGLMADPTFNAGIDKLLSGPDTLDNLTTALGFDLNALRTRGVTLAKSRAEARQVRLDLAWAEWQTSGEARLQAVRILALQKQFDVERQSLDALTVLRERTETAVRSGDQAADQLQTAQTAARDAEDKFNTTERALGAARFELNRLLGLPPSTNLSLAPEAFPEALPGAPTDAAHLYAIALAHRSDLAALREGYAAEENGVRLAVMNQFPTLNLTITATRDTTGNKTLGPAVDFTLPLWNRNRGGLAVEKATREGLKAEYEARLFQTRAEIAAAVDDLMIARRQRQRLLDDRPAQQAMAERASTAARRGDISVAAAEATQQVARDKLSQLGQAEQDIAELTISLELLTGTPQEEWTQ